MEASAASGPGPTTVGPEPGERSIVWAGFPIIGAGAAVVVKVLAGWATSLAWFPFRGPLELIDSLPDPQATVGSLVLGAVAGLAVAFLAERDYLRLTISDQRVTVAHADTIRTFDRTATSAIFVDGKDLVVLGHATEELLREPGDVEVKRLGPALRDHGYPWRPDGDPYREDYRRWVEDTPDLSAGVNALFKARTRAMERKDAEDVAHLRSELAKLGVVVRDESNRQFWRLTLPGSMAEGE